MTPYLESLYSRQPLRVQYPHCDWRVLHAPQACAYCDLHPDWQQERIDAKVLFTDDPRNMVLVDELLMTGTLPDGNLRPCPGMLARGDSINRWGGNQAKPAPAPE